jgi:uncharacterized membrane protein YidH (DUF202 family)
MTGQGSQVGVLLVGLGLLLVAVGLVAWAGGFSWLGRLPGDLRFEGERTRVYVPITSMIVVSLALTLVLNLIRRLF